MVSFVLIQKTEKLIYPKLSIMFCIKVMGACLVCPLNSLIVCLKTFIIDAFCLLVFLSVYAVPVVTSKVTIDDTYSRCPMIKFFLMVISWLVLLITGTRKLFLIPSFNETMLSTQ